MHKLLDQATMAKQNLFEIEQALRDINTLCELGELQATDFYVQVERIVFFLKKLQTKLPEDSSLDTSWIKAYSSNPKGDNATKYVPTVMVDECADGAGAGRCEFDRTSIARWSDGSA